MDGDFAGEILVVVNWHECEVKFFDSKFKVLDYLADSLDDACQIWKLIEGNLYDLYEMVLLDWDLVKR